MLDQADISDIAALKARRYGRESPNSDLRISRGDEVRLMAQSGIELPTSNLAWASNRLLGAGALDGGI